MDALKMNSFDLTQSHIRAFQPGIQPQAPVRGGGVPAAMDSNPLQDRVSTGDAEGREGFIPLPLSNSWFKVVVKDLKEHPFGPFEVFADAAKWTLKDPASPLNDPIGCMKSGVQPFLNAAMQVAKDPLGPVLGAFGKLPPGSTPSHEGAYFASHSVREGGS